MNEGDLGNLRDERNLRGEKEGDDCIGKERISPRPYSQASRGVWNSRLFCFGGVCGRGQQQQQQQHGQSRVWQPVLPHAAEKTGDPAALHPAPRCRRSGPERAAEQLGFMLFFVQAAGSTHTSSLNKAEVFEHFLKGSLTA